MESTHIVFNREYKDDLPKYLNIEKYRNLLCQIPDVDSETIQQQIKDAYLEFYCKCGCHSFLVYPNIEKVLTPLQGEAGLYREIAFNTNYEEELNVMLFTDSGGALSQVTIFYGVGNVAPVPEDLEIRSVNSIWTSSIYDDFISKKI